MLDNNAKLIDKILLLKEQNKDSKLLIFFFKFHFYLCINLFIPTREQQQLKQTLMKLAELADLQQKSKAGQGGQPGVQVPNYFQNQNHFLQKLHQCLELTEEK